MPTAGVAGAEARALPIDVLRSIVETGHALGLEITAEGIEDAATADLVIGLGVDSLQGFHLGAPVVAGDLRLPRSAGRLGPRARIGADESSPRR